MKKHFKFLIGLFVIFSLTTIVHASDDTDYTITLEEDNEPEYVDANPVRNRMPARPIICTINKCGISISGYSCCFISYEIWDEEGEVCLGSFANESDFIKELFSMQGKYQLRFVSTEFTLVGYIFI